ncbi:MAG: prenyltransferase/squalene oxidase repeat-containing protein [Kiritimatiellia bacterium]
MAEEEEQVVNQMAPEQKMAELFDELPFKKKVRKFFEGLKQPPDTGEYKWARLQLLRLCAPVAAVVVPIIAMILLSIFAAIRPEIVRTYDVKILNPEPPRELEEPIEPPDPIEPPEPVDDFEVDLTKPPTRFAGPATDFSPKPADFNAVALVKSPVIMKGIYGARNSGMRGQALNKYGGNAITELAVLRALRWLKKYQEEDGSWSTATAHGKGRYRGAKAGMTGLGLLTFLAHGETPASEEFGFTVEKAMQWLIENQTAEGNFEHRDNHDYCLPIAAYALSEAYGLTKIPAVQESAQKAIKAILKGQHASGGWNYNMNQENRDDTSIMAWCAQALKAAKMAGLFYGTDDEGAVNQAMDKAITAFKANYLKDAEYGGHFKYTNESDAHPQLTGLGVLCLQLLGEAGCPEVKGGLQWLDRNCKFTVEEPWSKRPFYHYYYITQAKFHAGGETWKQWNKEFSIPLCREQFVIKGAGVDGKDIGYWDSWSRIEREYGPVYNTTLAALMLQVYYRYLPTFMGAPRQAGGAQEQETKKSFKSGDDIGVRITM